MPAAARSQKKKHPESEASRPARQERACVVDMPRQARTKRVEEVIQILNIEKCADTVSHPARARQLCTLVCVALPALGGSLTKPAQRQFFRTSGDGKVNATVSFEITQCRTKDRRTALSKMLWRKGCLRTISLIMKLETSCAFDPPGRGHRGREAGPTGDLRLGSRVPVISHSPKQPRQIFCLLCLVSRSCPACPGLPSAVRVDISVAEHSQREVRSQIANMPEAVSAGG